MFGCTNHSPLYDAMPTVSQRRHLQAPLAATIVSKLRLNTLLLVKHISLVFCLVLTGCQAQWVSKYDAKFDQQITNLHKKAHMHLEGLKVIGWPNCNYLSSQDLYIELITDIEVVLTRAQTIDNNEHTISQVKSLKKQLVEIRNMHQDTGKEKTCMSTRYLEMSQRFLGQIVRATLWLEQGKKRQFLEPSKYDQPIQDRLPEYLMPKQS